MTLARLLAPLRRLRRRVLLHRRSLAALCAAAAVLVGFEVASPPPAPTVAVWTAGRALPGGVVLTGSDLAPRELPPEAVPDDAVTDPREVVGRVLAAPVARGETVTTLRVVRRGLLRGYPGSTAVPLRVTDGEVVSLLRVGDRVSFVVADPDGRGEPQLLVEDVPVVAVPRASAGLGGVAGGSGRLVVVAVPDGEAADVAARAATSILIPVWRD
ncbi:Flp pilus assembly protein CpaB [Nocardioides scoriae]|uniref:Flp pilus assembly protein CpaB n=1 Tax=Nocardioides scoriae TaxID=642780 RepID=A0A1H1S2N7_9ACTN|nr:SAF domain-containing protein [Nocardioides scoriae]SDS42262.1 Flp pilus assembly protein CpaB [Nocardioides scoriae]